MLESTDLRSKIKYCAKNQTQSQCPTRSVLDVTNMGDFISNLFIPACVRGKDFDEKPSQQKQKVRVSRGALVEAQQALVYLSPHSGVEMKHSPGESVVHPPSSTRSVWNRCQSCSFSFRNACVTTYGQPTEVTFLVIAINSLTRTEPYMAWF